MDQPKPLRAGKTRPPLIPAVVRINVTEPYSVREWSTKFGCSTEQLRAAVTAVGNVAADVARYLTSVPDGDVAREALRGHSARTAPRPEPRLAAAAPGQR